MTQPTSYDAEHVADLLRVLPPAPAAWVAAAQRLGRSWQPPPGRRDTKAPFEDAADGVTDPDAASDDGPGEPPRGEQD